MQGILLYSRDHAARGLLGPGKEVHVRMARTEAFQVGRTAGELTGFLDTLTAGFTCRYCPHNQRVTVLLLTSDAFTERSDARLAWTGDSRAAGLIMQREVHLKVGWQASGWERGRAGGQHPALS